MIYQDATAPLEARVEDLVSRMTTAEKIGQMTQVEKNSARPGDVTELALGSVLSGGGGNPETNTPAAWAEMVHGFQAEALATRLAIPLLYGVDAVHGHNNVRGATIFPHLVSLGAAGDTELTRRVARATAVECAATGIRWDFAPMVSVVQDIRWGRSYEAFGDETAAVAAHSAAYVRGMQDGTEAGQARIDVLATPKHYLGDGATVWGSSRMSMLGASFRIDQGDMVVDEATLRERFLPPYRAAVEAGALSIMASFSSWRGEKMHGHHYLLTDVLKGELGFTGFVVSDWMAIHQLEPDFYSAVVRAVNAGVDMSMTPYDSRGFITALTAALERGDVAAARIDDAVRRILRAKFALGLFERPYGDPSQLPLVGAAAHRALGREAARRSVVLLRNERGVLPIREPGRLIFVAGEAADDVGLQCGGWTIKWQGVHGRTVTDGTTVLEGLQETAPAGTRLQFNRFGRFEHVTDVSGAPLTADVGIVVLHEEPYAEGFGDREDLSLTAEQVALLERVRACSRRVVALLLTGRPVIITGQLPLADAWVAAWWPGTEGQGVGDVLFGHQPFTGRLPYHWPRSMAQLPLDTLLADPDGPLFSRGHGLAG